MGRRSQEQGEGAAKERTSNSLVRRSTVARRLNWEKAARMQKVRLDDPDDDHDQLPRIGSSADKKRYFEEEGYREVKIRSIRSKKLKNTPSKKDFGAIRQALDALQRELIAVFDRENSRLI